MQDIGKLVGLQQDYFERGATRDISWRIRALKTLKAGLEQHEQKLLAALKDDLGKSAFEAYATELGIVHREINFALSHIRRWTRPRRVPTPFFHFPSTSRILHDPYGVCLILSPWNYPAQLTLAPLVGAIAAGNCVILKPSNQSSATSQALADLIESCFAPEHVAVVQGGREENQQLFHAPVDYIFFTGSPEVGRLAMQAAAERLIPVTLELGGKSPCIVAADADIDLAAKRIAWGKFLNAGQTCIAPDYVLAHASIRQELIEHLQKYIRAFYGEDACRNPDFPHIVNQRHFERLCTLIDDEKDVIGAQRDPSSLRIAPTLLPNATWDCAAMQEEIFGPVLPILTFDSLDDALECIAKRPRPLALYLFTRDRALEKHVLARVRFGGGCINDTVVHISNEHLPFGGVGQSGMGSYHGKASFNTFSRQKSVLRHALWPDIALRYPPGVELRWLKRLMK